MTRSNDNSTESPDEGFEPVCEVDDIPDVMPKRVEVDGRGILICKSGGSLYAVDEICPHEQESMRYGVVRSGEIVCPHHRYHFNLETGRSNRRCPPVAVYDVKVEDGTVYLRVDDPRS